MAGNVNECQTIRSPTQASNSPAIIRLSTVQKSLLGFIVRVSSSHFNRLKEVIEKLYRDVALAVHSRLIYISTNNKNSG